MPATRRLTVPKFIDCEQRSSEWFKVRCGRITASHMGELTAYLKSGKGEMKARADYRMQLLSERLTGQVAQHFVTNEMKWGQEQEEYARSSYEQRKGVMVDSIGFAIHPSLDFAGSSPDGLVDLDSGIEIKCLTTARHLEIWKSREVPQDYYDQCQWNMQCCEREKWDFVCFDSRLPEHLQLLIIPVTYDEARVADLESEAIKMNAEVEQMIAELRVTA
jgi:putative phage-type endonuclease